MVGSWKSNESQLWVESKKKGIVTHVVTSPTFHIVLKTTVHLANYPYHLISGVKVNTLCHWVINIFMLEFVSQLQGRLSMKNLAELF